MNIKCNNSLWSEGERDNVINRALDIHLETKRKKKMDERPCKKPRYDTVSSDESDDSVDDEYTELLDIDEEDSDEQEANDHEETSDIEEDKGNEL